MSDQVMCPGAMTVPGWNAHPVEKDEPLYGRVHRRCYDCATADGVPTGDELEREARAMGQAGMG